MGEQFLITMPICGEAITVTNDHGDNWIVACILEPGDHLYHSGSLFWPMEEVTP